MSLSSRSSDTASPERSRTSGSKSTDGKSVYLPDRLGRLGQGTWMSPRELRDPFGRLTGGDAGGTRPGSDDLYELALSLSGPVGESGENRPEDVAKVEALLGASGHLDLDATGGPTGYFGARTDQAVRNFQKDHGLKVDGRLNPDGESIGELTRVYDVSSTGPAGVTPLPGQGAPLEHAVARYWDPETGEFRKPPEVVLLEAGAKGSGVSVEDGGDGGQPMSLLDKPGPSAGLQETSESAEAEGRGTYKPLSDEAVGKLAENLHQAMQSGDGKRLDGVRRALNAYPEAERKRIEGAASEYLTAAAVFDALQPPSDPDVFASGDWQVRRDAVKESLAQLRDTNPKKFDQLQKDFERDHTSVYRFPELLVHDLGAISYLRDNLSADENQIRESAPRHGFDPDYVLLFRDVVMGNTKSQEDVDDRIRDLREKVGGPGLNGLRFAMEKITNYAKKPKKYTPEDKIGFLADWTGFMRDAYRKKHDPVVGIARNTSGFVGSYSRGRNSRTMLNEQGKIDALGRGQRGAKPE